MQCIQTWAALSALLEQEPDPYFIRFLTLRRQQLEAFGELSDLGGIYLVQPGDSIPDVERAVGFPIASGPIDGVRYPDPDFQPGWEWIERHPTFWEAPFVLSDDGSGFILIVLDRPDIDEALRAMMTAFAP